MSWGVEKESTLGLEKGTKAAEHPSAYGEFHQILSRTKIEISFKMEKKLPTCKIFMSPPS